MADMSAVCTGFSMWAAFVLIVGVDTSVMRTEDGRDTNKEGTISADCSVTRQPASPVGHFESDEKWEIEKCPRI